MRRLALLAAAGTLTVAVAACGSSGGSSPAPSVASSSSSSSSSATTPAASAPASSSAASSSAASTPAAVAVPTYYLSLGDSVAFGYQQAKLNAELKAGDYSAASFDTGYSDLVAAALKKRSPSIVTANYGCPGETTHSYLAGGCPFTAVGGGLHDPHTGTQAAAAKAFLAAHTGPGVITMSLGANDVNAVLKACPTLATSCVLPKIGSVLDGVKTNLTTIFQALRAEAPNSTIVTLQLYDPYVVDSAAADLVVDELNDEIAGAAATSGVKLADAFPVFNPTDQ